jgi:hypothetical protein
MNINFELKRKLVIVSLIAVLLIVMVVALDWWGMRIFPTRIVGKSVSGQVVERETGKPLPDALVVVRWKTSVANSHGGVTSACYHIEYAITDKGGRFSTERWAIQPNDFDFGVQKSRRQLGGIIAVVKPGYVAAASDWPNHGGSQQLFNQNSEPNDIKMALGRNFLPGEAVPANTIRYKGLDSLEFNLSQCEILPWFYDGIRGKPPQAIGEADRRSLEAHAAVSVFQGQAFATLYPHTLQESPDQGGPPSYARRATVMPYEFEYFGIKPRPIPIELTTRPVADFADPPVEKSFTSNVTQ